MTPQQLENAARVFVVAALSGDPRADELLDRLSERVGMTKEDCHQRIIAMTVGVFQ